MSLTCRCPNVTKVVAKKKRHALETSRNASRAKKGTTKEPPRQSTKTHNPRFVVSPLELGLGTHNPRFFGWPLELGLGTHHP